MKVTVCELRNDRRGLERDWPALADHVAAAGSDLVLLPEMPFAPWLAAGEQLDPEAWTEAVVAHESWLQRLGELGAPTVLGTRPVVLDDRRLNQSFCWASGHGEVGPVHHKRHLPAEEAFWEARWYSPGDGRFEPVEVAGIDVGFLICTEMWFFEHARDYGRSGVQLLASPRATLAPSVDKWLAGGRAAAVVAGAYCLSSNFSGDAGGGNRWGGTGWVVEPEEGDVLGTTSPDEPFLTVEIDPAAADAAKKTYPRYIGSPPSPSPPTRRV